MSDSATSEKTSGTTGAYIHIAPSGSTFNSSFNYVSAGTSIAVPTSAVVAEVEAIIEDTYIRAYHALVPKRTIEEEEAEEQEWHAIISQPHVQQGLSRLAEGIRQQIATGEIEEGGFAVE